MHINLNSLHSIRELTIREQAQAIDQFLRGFPHFLDTKKLNTLRLDLMQSGKSEVDTFLPKLEKL